MAHASSFSEFCPCLNNSAHCQMHVQTGADGNLQCMRAQIHHTSLSWLKFSKDGIVQRMLWPICGKRNAPILERSHCWRRTSSRYALEFQQVELLAFSFASLTDEGRFVTRKFTFELRNKNRITTLAVKWDFLSLLFCVNVRRADDFRINASRAVPFLCLSIQRHVWRGMCGLTTETLPVLIWSPHGHFISW